MYITVYIQNVYCIYIYIGIQTGKSVEFIFHITLHIDKNVIKSLLWRQNVTAKVVSKVSKNKLVKRKRSLPWHNSAEQHFEALVFCREHRIFPRKVLWSGWVVGWLQRMDPMLGSLWSCTLFQIWSLVSEALAQHARCKLVHLFKLLPTVFDFFCHPTKKYLPKFITPKTTPVSVWFGLFHLQKFHSRASKWFTSRRCAPSATSEFTTSIPGHY